MSFAELAKKASKFAIDNSPTILTSFGVVGTVTTAYFAGKASFLASDIIRLKEADDEKRGVPMPDDPKDVLKQRVQLVWKLYVPAVTMGAATVACIIGSNRIGNHRAASLAVASSLTSKAFEEYKDKVVEKIGEKKEEQIRAEIIQDRINNDWNDDSIEIHGKDTGQVCYDKFGGQYVWNTAGGIREAMIDLNQIIIQQGYATVADFYDILGIPAFSWAHEIGWSSDHIPRMKFSAALTPGGKPVVAFEYDVEPVRNYMRFH